MKERKNPFESLRVPGICGNVSSGAFQSDTIFSQGSTASLKIRTDTIEPGKWAFGFYLQTGDVTREMLPGESSGWFRSQDDARLYALGHIRFGSVDIPEDMKFALDAAISKLRNVPLFEL